MMWSNINTCWLTKWTSYLQRTFLHFCTYHKWYDSGVGGLFAKLCLALATPWTVALQAPLSRGFSRQEYWKVVISFSRGSSPPMYQTWVSCIEGRFLPTELQGKSINGTFTLRWFSLFSNSIGKVMYTSRSITYFVDLSACILLLFTLRASAIEAVALIFLFLFFLWYYVHLISLFFFTEFCLCYHKC